MVYQLSSLRVLAAAKEIQTARQSFPDLAVKISIASGSAWVTGEKLTLDVAVVYGLEETQS